MKLLPLCLLLLSCVGPRPYIYSPEHVLHATNATVAIVADVEGAPEIFCTGFFVDARTIVTAAHCIIEETLLGPARLSVGDSMHFVTYRQWSGEGMRDGSAPRLAWVAGIDSDHDVAVLRAAHYQSREWFETTNDAPIGRRCYAMGHPGRASWSLTAGVVSAQRRHWIQCSAPLWFGNSGGPVFDDLGRVIGVADAIIQGVPHLGLSVQIRYAMALL